MWASLSIATFEMCKTSLGTKTHCQGAFFPNQGHSRPYFRGLILQNAQKLAPNLDTKCVKLYQCNHPKRQEALMMGLLNLAMRPFRRHWERRLSAIEAELPLRWATARRSRKNLNREILNGEGSFMDAVDRYDLDKYVLAGLIGRKRRLKNRLASL